MIVDCNEARDRLELSQWPDLSSSVKSSRHQSCSTPLQGQLAVEAEKSLRPPPWPHDRPSSFNHGDYTSQANNNTSLLFHYQHYYHHHSYHHQPQQPHQPIMFTPTSDKSILPPSPTKRRRRKSSRRVFLALNVEQKHSRKINLQVWNCNWVYIDINFSLLVPSNVL